MTPVWRKALAVATPEEIEREIVVKKTLTKALAEAQRLLQQLHVNSNEPTVSNENSNAMCEVLEAMFIHGLKDTFVHRVTAILRGNIHKIPEPNVWPFLLIFTHKDAISQITQLTQVSTDIGRSRAWLRIAINDGLLESYLSAMTNDKKSLQYYYNHAAFLRDYEQSDILRKYIQGVRALKFQLSYNVHHLNQWSSGPLMLAGIWAPPLAPEPVTTGVDVASYCGESIPVPLTPTRRTMKQHEFNSNVPTEDESDMSRYLAFDVNYCNTVNDNKDSLGSSPGSCPDPPVYFDFTGSEQTSKTKITAIHNVEETTVTDAYQKTVDTSDNDNSEFATRSVKADSCSCFSSMGILKSPSEVIRGITDGVAEAEMSEDLNNMQQAGNSLMGKMGWSSSFDEESNANLTTNDRNHSNEPESFEGLLKNYSPVFGSIIRTPNFDDVMNALVSTTNDQQSLSALAQTPNSDENASDIFEYEVIPRTFSINSSNADFRTRELIDMIGTIQNEKGLDKQNFQCKGCSQPIGIIYGKVRVCSYDAHYYCNDCHENSESVIPARIIHNWDFKKYKVAKHTKAFLERVEDEPLLDMYTFNCSLYDAIEEISHMLKLRTKLNSLRSYLFTCRESVVAELRKKVWPKEYLYEHIHLYSLSDLLQIPNGNLRQQLEKIINFAAKHVYDCQLCSSKGFVCEVCKSTKIVYPFEIDVTYRCKECLAVFHDQCMNAQKPCPKCLRHEKRQNLHEYAWNVEHGEV